MYNSEEAALFSVRANNGLCSHAYIVDGASGVGKLDFALHCARAMLCTDSEKPCGECPSCRKALDGNHPDIFVVGKEKTANMDTVRELIRRSSLKPNDADKQIFIVCNAGKLRQDAQNALLKLFEEPPETVAIFLLTESRSSLLPTVLSRGQRIHLDGMKENDLRTRLCEKYPKVSARDLSVAVKIARGNLGVAEKYLSKESAHNRALAEKVLFHALSRDAYELTVALIAPKFKREQLHAVLGELIFIVSEAEKRQYGIEGFVPEDGDIAYKLKKASKRALAAICEMTQLCMISLENNANVNTAASKLALDLLVAAAR